MGSTTRLNGHSEIKSSSSGNLSAPVEDIAKASLGRLSISQNSDPVKETKSSGRLSTSQNSDLNKESKSFACMLSLVLLLLYSIFLFWKQLIHVPEFPPKLLVEYFLLAFAFSKSFYVI